jgi:hypothetical protein
MTAVNLTEFNNHAQRYLSKLDTGGEILIKNKDKSYKLSLVIDDEDGTYGVPLLTKEEYEARTEQADKDYKAYLAGDKSKGIEYSSEEFEKLLGL